MYTIEIIRNYTRDAARQSAAKSRQAAIQSSLELLSPRPRYELQGKVLHDWHVLRQPHSAKHTPSPMAASKASTHGQQNSSTTSGALYTGAFVGMPRSAAYKCVVATVKANRAADPTAIMRRSIAHPPLSTDR